VNALVARHARRTLYLQRLQAALIEAQREGGDTTQLADAINRQMLAWRREQQALKTYLRKVIANLEVFATKAGDERDVHAGGAA